MAIDRASLAMAKSLGINLRGGYVRNTDGRFVMGGLSGKYPGAHAKGYALRSRVVWWLNTAEVLVGLEFNVHHKNRIRDDDRFQNLEKISHHEHTLLHHAAGVPMQSRVCKGCHRTFLIAKSRLTENGRGRYCSQACYQAAPKLKKRAIVTCQYCANTFEATPFRASRLRFCSHRCSANYRWKEQACASC